MGSRWFRARTVAQISMQIVDQFWVQINCISSDVLVQTRAELVQINS